MDENDLKDENNNNNNNNNMENEEEVDENGSPLLPIPPQVDDIDMALGEEEEEEEEEEEDEEKDNLERAVSPMSEDSDEPIRKQHSDVDEPPATAPAPVEEEEEEDDALVIEPVPWKDEDDEVLAEETFEWTLANFSKATDDVVRSPRFTVHNVPWQLMIYPHGNQNGKKNTGCFLELDKSSFSPSMDWTCFVVFKIGLRLKDGRKFEKWAKNRFVDTSTNWGFASLLEMKYVRDEKYGILVDDSVTYCATVRILAGKDINLWGIYANYDSKEATGMVGLENQGATCYMNSLLQTLYHTNMLRHAVFQMPTEKDDPVKGVALALQRVFFRLQTKPTAVETTELTRSFGWDSIQAFMQHDVQELTRVLMDNMEEKMKGTPVEGFIGKLFEGKMKSYIKCINVDYESSREESYYDISLNVKGMKTLYNSFKDYVKVEKMDGENQYRAEGHGLQDADKGIIFRSFPPVLHLQLKRFEYSWERDESEKINDRFEFPEHLNLDEFLEAPEATPASYTLHSVLVHSGGIHGGHYVVFVRPGLDGRPGDAANQWFKFDDESVTKTARENAIERNYGEDPMERRWRSFSNAYMLVYIRDNMIEEVMRPLAIDDIPAPLRLRFQTEDEDKRRKDEERRLATSMVDVMFVTDEHIAQNTLSDLVPEKRFTQVAKTAKVPKDATIKAMISLLGREVQVDESRLRVWPFISRENKTFRPDEAFDDSQMGKTVASFSKTISSTNYQSPPTMRLSVYLEIIPEVPDEAPFPSDYDSAAGDFIVFIKWFDHVTGELSYLGHAIVNGEWRIEQLAPGVLAAKNLPPETQLAAFEEVRATMTNVLLMHQTFAHHEMQVGDILTWQIHPEQQDPASAKFPTCKDYYTFLLNQVMVEFREVNKSDAAGVKVKLDRRMDYGKVAQRLAAELNIPTPENIQFSHGTYQNPLHNVFEPPRSLDEMLKMCGKLVVYYEVLPLSLDEMQAKVRLNDLAVLNHATYTVEQHDGLLLDRSATFADLMEHLRPSVKPWEHGSGALRVLRIERWSAVVMRPEERVDRFSECTLRVEEVPADQVEPLPQDCGVFLFTHVWKGFPHGIPFFFTIRDKETVGDLKLRLKEYMKVSDKEWATWKFGCGSHFKSAYPPDDFEIDLETLHSVTFFFEHVDRAHKRTGFWAEQAVKIHN